MILRDTRYDVIVKEKPVRILSPFRCISRNRHPARFSKWKTHNGIEVTREVLLKTCLKIRSDTALSTRLDKENLFKSALQ